MCRQRGHSYVTTLGHLWLSLWNGLKSSKGKLELRGKSLSQGLLADTIYLFLLSELELMTVVQCRKKVVMALDELTKIKNVTNVQLQLKGFKPMKCLKDYHNLRPPTFIYPDEEVLSVPVVMWSCCGYESEMLPWRLMPHSSVVSVHWNYLITAIVHVVGKSYIDCRPIS